MSKDQYVAVLPDGNEHFCESIPTTTQKEKSMCAEAVRAYGLKTSRKNPVDVIVKLYRLVINKGKLERQFCGTYHIQPDFERMTQAEYDSEMIDILKHVPVEFHGYVYGEAYDRGHSSGMEECVSIASSIVDNLLPCIKNYTRSLQGN